ncbi:MAG: 2Fe-2S iron-sulfur cluster-binding protein [Magnetospiraceae bacterium]
MKHTVTILDTNETYDCDAKENMLTAMVRIGRKGIPSGCHGGGCGVCKIHVKSGKYRAIVMSRQHVSIQEQNQDIVLACRCFPESDIELEVIGKMKKRFVSEPRKFGLV